MAPKKESSTYTPLSDIEDIDLENDSDTTLGSNRFPSTSPKPASRRRSTHISPRTARIECLLVWVRWGSVIILQSLILFFLLKGRKTDMNEGDEDWVPADTETGGDINGLYVPRES
ncbi:hypothetical protein ACMFMF_006645 [Clarireedia jacksonii]